MAQSSPFWQTNPLLLSFASIAATCGIIAAYSVYSEQSPTNGLRRSNAVHRPRRDRYAPVIDTLSGTPDAPLGTILIKRGELEYEINLASNPLPSADELQHLFARPSEETRTELIDVALDLVLTACLGAREHSVTRDALCELGFNRLIDAIASRDEHLIRLDASDIARSLHIEDISDEQIERAVSKFLCSEMWLGSLASSAGDDGTNIAETEEIDAFIASSAEPSQGLRGLIYYIAEEDAKRKAYEHRGISCEECGEMPIRGIRWHCLNCPDFDLCASCEMHTEHPKTHVFAKIKIPLPVLSQPTKEYRLWYPGDPRKVHAPLDAAFRRRLCQEHGFEETQIDALFDQFTCLANVPWYEDSSDIKAAIDKRAFNRALTCEKWSSKATSNAIYDRMFAFYDTDGNGFIGFNEFISGLAYLRGPARFASLQRTIKGYDVDGDGFVDRTDFLRLLRAKFTIQQQLVLDSIEGQETERTQDSSDVLRSSQPISSIFAQEDIPQGNTRPPRQKTLNGFGDMQPLHSTKTILNDEDPWPRAEDTTGNADLPAHQRLRDHLSRFEELLHDTVEHSVSAELEHGSELVEIAGFDRPRSDVRTGLDDYDENDAQLDPHIQDILWQATEHGIQSILNVLFLPREDEDQEAIDTRAERARWRKEIDDLWSDENGFEGQAEKTLKNDSLLAVRMSSSTPSALPQDCVNPGHSNVAFTSSIVPTDWESLERRERDIIDTSLEELLDTLGYSVRGDEANNEEEGSTRSSSAGPTSPWDAVTQSGSRLPPTTLTRSNNDPTLPQNMPEKEVDVVRSRDSARAQARELHKTPLTSDPSSEHPPSTRELQHFSRMDHVDRQLQARGGLGRLTYDEIEAITVSSGTELRGLVKSWLEWASF